jgi:glyoxylase-like metal-dependent hydrolase (beta-lactamase superfamily II)
MITNNILRGRAERIERPLDRRATIVLALLLIAGLASVALAQQSSEPLALTPHLLQRGVYWVSGGVSNTGFIVGDKGVVVFDAQMTPEAAHKCLAEIAKVTSKPVNKIIVSHADPDHVGGLPGYPIGTAIIAQENTKSEIQVSAADPSAPAGIGTMYKTLLDFLPTQTIGSTETLVLDGVRMVLMYTGPAHTSGDLAVYLPLQKIVFAGDIITTNTGPYPVIHFGGSSLGWIASMKALLALGADTYVSGHGPIETKTMLQARLRVAVQRRDQIRAMVNENKSLAEVEQSLPDPGVGTMPFATFTQTVYAELTKGYPPATAPWYNRIKK